MSEITVGRIEELNSKPAQPTKFPSHVAGTCGRCAKLEAEVTELEARNDNLWMKYQADEADAADKIAKLEADLVQEKERSKKLAEALVLLQREYNNLEAAP